jgi:phage tail-like protein
MRLLPESGTLVMQGARHWARCSFEHTTLLKDVVTLAPIDPTPIDPGPLAPRPGVDIEAFAGLAFDRHCRLFHSIPEEGRVEYLLWGRQTELKVHDDPPRRFEISGPESEIAGMTPSAMPRVPRALACDDSDYLYIGDGGDVDSPPCLWLVDVWQHEIARRIALDAAPLDLCSAGGSVYALLKRRAGSRLAQTWLRLSPCDPPRSLPWPAGVSNATRLDVAATQGAASRAFVLVDANTRAARLMCLSDPSLSLEVQYCSDFLILSDEGAFGSTFVLARGAGDDFVMRHLEGRTFGSPEYLRAPNYDGRGIACAPDGRIAFWTAHGLRHAARARPRHEPSGTVVGFALDSNREQNEWGRLTVEACIPQGTQVSVRCFTRDDLDYRDPIARQAPAGESNPAAIKRADLTPLPSSAALNERGFAQQRLFRDDHLPPMAAPPADAFALYEAPVIAPPGRFLWVVLMLEGTGSKTPRVREIRVEFPGHGLLRQLPKTLWRDPHAKEFLRRYLMPLAAEIDEWGRVAGMRHRLIDPRIAPAEALEWLGSFVGLAMDPCWPEHARREMLRNAVRLFRIRGTCGGLREMLHILTASQVLIIEKFRLRSGGVVGNPVARTSRSVLGAGFRVGGNIGTSASVAVPGIGERPADDDAHRFTVMIVARLSDEQMRCTRRLIETHKPAHTMFDLCSVETGTRVGVGLHVGLASVIGPNSGFSLLTLGDAVLGKGYLLGRAELERSAARGSAGAIGDCNEKAGT